jgi:hypothetical protein
MATIYDLIEITSIQADTTYSSTDGSMLGVVDGVRLQRNGVDDNDGEFDIGDALLIGGVSFAISRIQEPSSSGRFILGDGSNRSFDPGSESNLPVIFLTVSNGSTVRYFSIPNDSYGDMSIAGIRTGSLTDVAGSDAAVISTANNNVSVVCFLRGSRISCTPDRQMAVENLRVGDWVDTVDQGPMQIRWIGHTPLACETLAACPELRPIRIAAGALGANRPANDLHLSPHHRILVKSQIARRLFGTTQVMLAAKHLVGLRGIDVELDQSGADYFHILLDSHQIVFANGAAVETLFLGPEAVKSVGHDIWAQIAVIHTDVQQAAMPPEPCRPLLSAKQARAFVAACKSNGHGSLQAGKISAKPRLSARSGVQRTGQVRQDGALVKAIC